jgi:hypothetical protein
MTRDVVTVTEATELTEIASLLEHKNIKRVPVMRDGKLFGIIRRANLVRALAATKGAPAGSNESDDRQNRRKLFVELRDQKWAHIWPEDIIVRDGVVNFWLSDDRPAAEADALRVAAESIPGVRGVQLHLYPSLRSLLFKHDRAEWITSGLVIAAQAGNSGASLFRCPWTRLPGGDAPEP